MNGPVTEARLASAAWECGRHQAALDAALTEWHAGPTISSSELQADPDFLQAGDVSNRLAHEYPGAADLRHAAVLATMAAAAAMLQAWAHWQVRLPSPPVASA